MFILKIKLIMKSNENLDTKIEIREINKKIMDVSTSLDKIKIKLGIK